MTVLLVAVGGAAGACLRFLLDGRIRRSQSSAFPWATLLVNLTGSLVLGFLAGAALLGVHAPDLRALLGTGLCGALTTYSTFGHDTVRLLLGGSRWLGLANIAATTVAGFGSGLLGVALAAALWN